VKSSFKKVDVNKYLDFKKISKDLVPTNHTSYKELDLISEKLMTSFGNYTSIIVTDIEKQEVLKDERTKLEKILITDSDKLINKLQEIIDSERELISKLLMKQ
jgi:hypothetical protein